jgi:hypothetical protein
LFSFPLPFGCVDDWMVTAPYDFFLKKIFFSLPLSVFWMIICLLSMGDETFLCPFGPTDWL